MTKAGLICMALGLASLAAFALIGSSLDADGFVREPFGLLPIGWFLLLVGALLTLSGLTRSWLRKH